MVEELFASCVDAFAASIESTVKQLLTEPWVLYGNNRDEKERGK